MSYPALPRPCDGTAGPAPNADPPRASVHSPRCGDPGCRDPGPFHGQLESPETHPYPSLHPALQTEPEALGSRITSPPPSPGRGWTWPFVFLLKAQRCPRHLSALLTLLVWEAAVYSL